MAGEIEAGAMEPEHAPGVLLTERIAFWTEFFKNVDGDELGNYTVAAIEELDDLWEQENLLGEECLVSGYGFWSEPADEEFSVNPDAPVIGGYQAGNIELVIKKGEVRGVIAKSLGFAVINATNEERPSPHLQYEIFTLESMSHPAVGQRIHCFAYLDPRPDRLSIVPIDAIEEPFYETTEIGEHIAENDAQMLVVDELSDYLVGLVSSTHFRRQNRKQQIQQIDNIIERAEVLTGLRNASMTLAPEYGYIPTLTEKGVDYRKIDLRDHAVSGICLGFTIAGRERLEHKAIRRDSDLLNKDEGLSVVMELDEESLSNLSASIGLNEDSLVIIPTILYKRYKLSRKLKKQRRKSVQQSQTDIQEQ